MQSFYIFNRADLDLRQ